MFIQTLDQKKVTAFQLLARHFRLLLYWKKNWTCFSSFASNNKAEAKHWYLSLHRVLPFLKCSYEERNPFWYKPSKEKTVPLYFYDSLLKRFSLISTFFFFSLFFSEGFDKNNYRDGFWQLKKRYIYIFMILKMFISGHKPCERELASLFSKLVFRAGASRLRGTTMHCKTEEVERFFRNAALSWFD